MMYSWDMKEVSKQQNLNDITEFITLRLIIETLWESLIAVSFMYLYVSISNDALFYGMSLNRMIELREQNMDADMNFLRVPFLKAILDSKKLKESAE